MFNQTFPEGDPFSRMLCDPDGDRQLGRSSRVSIDGGVMETEVTVDGIAHQFEEEGARISVVQTEERISLSLGNAFTAVYDRDTGAIVSIEASLGAMALFAARTGVGAAQALWEPTFEMIQEKQDVRMQVDFTSRIAGITFFRADMNRCELTEVSFGAVLNDVGEGVYPQVVYQEWHGKSPLFGLPVRLLVEEQRVCLIVQDDEYGWVLPVSGFYNKTITSALTPAELKAMVNEVFPSENY